MSEFTNSKGRMVCTLRISQLAHESGRSPAALLQFVRRDGFDAVELSIKENAQADAEFAADFMVTHADVIREARHVVRQQALRSS